MAALAIQRGALKAYEDIKSVVQNAAARETPKVIADNTGLTDTGIRKIREGLSGVRAETLITFMFADMEVARVIERYARLAQEPDFWSHEGQREFHKYVRRDVLGGGRGGK